MALIALRYDLRVPTWGTATARDLHAAFLEQVRWGDRIGVDMAIVSEHHGAEDSFMSAPVTLAAAILGGTNRISVNISALLLPLHDPVRLAEQLAAVDLIAPGRLSIILGTGYRDEEFQMAGLEFKNRLEILEEWIGVLRQAFTGEYFEWRGRRIRVTPKPATPGGPFLLMGGSSEKAARRAARLRLGFAAADADQQLADWYYDECKQIGFNEGYCSVPTRLGFVHVTEDPERDWARIAPHAFHEARTYASWQRKGQMSAVTVKQAETIEDLKASGVYQIITPAECVELYNSLGDFGALVLHPLMGGLSPEIAAEGLELFESDVLPVIRPAVV
jgi:alkanesulfonate monooxygenase SsuD/methylene tetrahydromethanopterin reductase-like flavin-dependent oxidoreductase (luciferase family)